MTLVSMVTTLALFGLLAALVVVAVWTARGAAQRATCTAQMRQLAGALIMYRNENGDYPPAYYEAWDREHKHVERVSWETILAGYVGERGLFACPCDPAGEGGGKLSPPGYSQSYDYVCGTEAAEERTGGRRLAAAAAGGGYDRKEAARSGVLLVCRHHDSGQSGRPHRVLVAYDDGSVRWEPLAKFVLETKQAPRSPRPGTTTR
jgi:type II secretory pathway pseudopilin PulG